MGIFFGNSISKYVINNNHKGFNNNYNKIKIFIRLSLIRFLYVSLIFLITDLVTTFGIFKLYYLPNKDNGRILNTIYLFKIFNKGNVLDNDLIFIIIVFLSYFITITTVYILIRLIINIKFLYLNKK